MNKTIRNQTTSISLLCNFTQFRRKFPKKKTKYSIYWTMIALKNSKRKVPSPVFLVKESKPISTSQAQTNRQNALTFFQCIQPVYYVSRVFGFTPFSFKFDSNAVITGYEVKPLDLIWFVISFFNYLFMAFIAWNTISTPTLEVSIILVYGNNLLVIVGLIFGAFSVAFDMFNRQRLVNLMKNSITFDKKVFRYEHEVVIERKIY